MVLCVALGGGNGGAGPGAPSLGIVVAVLTPESSPVYGASDGRGALVIGIDPTGPAATGGVLPGDVIRTFAGKIVTGPSSVVAIVQSLRVGERTQMVVRRAGAERKLTLVIGDGATLDPGQSPQVLDGRYTEAVAAFEGNDPARAVTITADLAQRGHGPGQNLLGVLIAMQLTGHGDPAAAAFWYRLAAHQGVSSAANNLGLHYWSGAGVPRDLGRAYYWLSLAASSGDPSAAESLNQVVAELQPSQRATADSWLAWTPPQPASPAPSTVAKPQQSAARDAVRKAQIELSRLGYDVGVADGVAGRRTKAAIRTFQSSAGLPVDGEVTPALLAALAAKPTPTKPTPTTAAPPTAAAQTAKPESPPPAQQGLGELGFPSGDLEIED